MSHEEGEVSDGDSPPTAKKPKLEVSEETKELVKTSGQLGVMLG